MKKDLVRRTWRRAVAFYADCLFRFLNTGNTSRNPAEYTRSLLRRYPYWPRGHAISIRRAIEVNDIETAHASVMALLTMDTAGIKDRYLAKLYLGQIYVRRGQSVKAIETLSPLREQMHLSGKQIDELLLEELGAAQMALGNYEEAVKILDSIPEERRTAEATSALTYSKSKRS